MVRGTKCWCITSYAEELKFDEDELKFIVFQREECPETKKKHWQIYVELKRAGSMADVKDIFEDDSVHCERTKGSRKQNIKYCSKSKTKISETTIIDKSRRFFSMTNGLVIVGRTAVGKSHYLWRNYPEAYSKQNKMWWPDYENESTVIWDEFDYKEYSINQLLTLLDQYPHKVPFKGGHIHFTSRTVYFSSNTHPSLWYPDAPIWQREALKRRLEVLKFDFFSGLVYNLLPL